MKTTNQIILIAILGLMVSACGNEQNEAVPSYLNGTQYGVLLHVDVSSSKTIPIANVGSATLDFNVNFEGDKRPVTSITATKTFKPKVGTVSAAIEHAKYTTFPVAVSNSMAEVIQGIPGLSTTADLKAGDSFEFKFIITYQDGGIATRYGTINNPNFSINFN